MKLARYTIMVAAATTVSLIISCASTNDPNSGMNQMLGNLRIKGGGSGPVGSGASALMQGVRAFDLEHNEQSKSALGESVAVAMTNTQRVDPNLALEKYVSLVGLTLADHCDDPSRSFVFGVIDSEEINACSSPNGTILVTRGALRQMKDESELAGVLAHEITHVLREHGIKAVVRAKQTDAMMIMASTEKNLGRFAALTDVGADIILKKGYDKEQERDADAGAIELARASGYDPAGLLRFLQRIEAQQPSKGGLSDLMKTHPGRPERIARLQRSIGSDANGATLGSRFASNVK